MVLSYLFLLPPKNRQHAPFITTAFLLTEIFTPPIEIVIRNTKQHKARKLFFDILFSSPIVGPLPSFLLSGGQNVLDAYKLGHEFTIYNQNDMFENLSWLNQFIFPDYNSQHLQKLGFHDSESILIEQIYSNKFYLLDTACWYQNFTPQLSALEENEEIEQINLHIASIIDLCPWCYQRLNYLMNPQLCQNQNEEEFTIISKQIFENILKKCNIIYDNQIKTTVNKLWNTENNLQIYVSFLMESTTPAIINGQTYLSRSNHKPGIQYKNFRYERRH